MQSVRGDKYFSNFIYLKRLSVFNVCFVYAVEHVLVQLSPSLLHKHEQLVIKLAKIWVFPYTVY